MDTNKSFYFTFKNPCQTAGVFYWIQLRIIENLPQYFQAIKPILAILEEVVYVGDLYH